MQFYVYSRKWAFQYSLSESTLVVGKLSTDLDNVSSVLTLGFWLSKNDEKDFQERFKEGNYVLKSDSFYTITQFKYTIYKDMYYIELTCEDGTIDLLSEVLVPWIKPSKSQTIDYYLEKILYDSGFDVGRIEGSKKLQLEYTSSETPKERLLSLLESFSMEAKTRFKIKNNTITGRYIDIVKQRGQVTGKRYYVGDEVESVAVTAQTGGLATAVRGIGGTPEGKKQVVLTGYKLTTEQSANGRYAILQDKVVDKIANKEWNRYINEDEFDTDDKNGGYLVAEVRDDRYLTQSGLADACISYLKKNSDSTKNYEVEFLTTDGIDVEVGDRIDIVHVDSELYLNSRVLVSEEDFIEKSLTLTLGEYKLKKSNLDYSVIALANELKDKINNIDTTVVVRSDTAPESTKVIWVDTSDPANETGVAKSYDEATGTWVDVGANGKNGKDGAPGKDGLTLKSTKQEFVGSTSGTTTPTSGWQTQVPTVPAGQFLWTRNTWVYSDDTVEYGYTVSMMGKNGNNGNDGIAGKDGTSIVSTTVTYVGSASGTVTPSSGWSSTIPSVPDGQFMWSKMVWKYSDGTSETGYAVAKIGDKGADGESAIPTDGQLLFNNTFAEVGKSAQSKVGWNYPSTVTILDPESDYPNYPILKIGGTTSTTKFSYSRNIPVVEGTQVLVSINVKIIGSEFNKMFTAMRFYDENSTETASSQADTANSGTSYANGYLDNGTTKGSAIPSANEITGNKVTVADAWTNFQYVVTVPSGAKYLKVLMYNSSSTATQYHLFRAPTVIAYQKGSDGADGKNGTDGADGKDGTNGIVTGSTLPKTGYEGQMFGLETTDDNGVQTNKMYKYTGGKWVETKIDQDSLNIYLLQAVKILTAELQAVKIANTYSTTSEGATLEGSTVLQNAELRSDYEVKGTNQSGNYTLNPLLLGFHQMVNGTLNKWIEYSYSGITAYDKTFGSGTLTAESLVQVPWINLPLASGSSTAEGNTPQYRKIRNLDGTYTVQIKGQLTNTTVTNNTGSTFTLATLPAGYRPTSNRFALGIGQGANSSIVTIGRMHVDVNGNLNYKHVYGVSNQAPTGYIILDTMTFPI